MATRAERTKAIDLLEQDLKGAEGIYLTDFGRISVGKITKLRTEFRQKGVKYVVVKNKLAKIALERSHKEALVEHLTGPVGMALAPKDPTTPAKVIRDFQKENKDLLPIKVAYVGGALFGQDEVMRLADLPSREVLLSQFLSCLKAPMCGLAGALNGILVKLAATLEAVRAQKEAAAN